MRKFLFFIIFFLLINIQSNMLILQSQPTSTPNIKNPNFLIANGEFITEQSIFRKKYSDSNEYGIEYTINLKFQCINKITHLSTTSFKLNQIWVLKASFFEQKLNDQIYSPESIELQFFKDDIKVGSLDPYEEDTLFSIDYIIEKNTGKITDIENDYNANNIRLYATFSSPGIYTGLFYNIREFNIDDNIDFYYPDRKNWEIGSIEYHPKFTRTPMNIISNNTMDNYDIWNLEYTSSTDTYDLISIIEKVEKITGLIFEHIWFFGTENYDISEVEYKIIELNDIVDEGPPQIIKPSHLILPSGTLSYILDFKIIENNLYSYVLTNNGSVITSYYSETSNIHLSTIPTISYSFNVTLETGNNTIVLTVTDSLGFSNEALVWIYVSQQETNLLDLPIDTNSLDFPIIYQMIISILLIRTINQKYKKQK